MHLSPSLAATALFVLVLGASAGCASTPDTPTPTPTPTPSATSTAPETPGVDPADDAAALDAWAMYWDATIRSFNGPDADPALWQAFSTDEVIITNTRLAQSYIDGGIVFTGAPVISDVTVTWEGRAAVVAGCIDATNWPGTQAGKPLPPRPNLVYPVALGVSLVGAEWRVNEGATLPAGVTC